MADSIDLQILTEKRRTALVSIIVDCVLEAVPLKAEFKIGFEDGSSAIFCLPTRALPLRYETRRVQSNISGKSYTVSTTQDDSVVKYCRSSRYAGVARTSAGLLLRMACFQTLIACDTLAFDRREVAN